MREHTDLVRAWKDLPSGAEAVLATVVATRGSVYRRPGARMLLTREGWVAGVDQRRLHRVRPGSDRL